MDKRKIPIPVKKKKVGPDPSQKYLQQWKDLFNAIDPERIKAYLPGDEGYPQSEYEFEMHTTRLNDGYDVHVHLFIRVSDYLVFTYGNELYCCPRNTSFASQWISEIDENMDTIDKIIPWEEMYQLLVEDTKNHFKRIPVPPEKSDESQ